MSLLCPLTWTLTCSLGSNSRLSNSILTTLRPFNWRDDCMEIKNKLMSSHLWSDQHNNVLYLVHINWMSISIADTNMTYTHLCSPVIWELVFYQLHCLFLAFCVRVCVCGWWLKIIVSIFVCVNPTYFIRRVSADSVILSSPSKLPIPLRTACSRNRKSSFLSNASQCIVHQNWLIW